MTHKKFRLGMLVIVLALVMAFVSCSKGSKDGGSGTTEGDSGGTTGSGVEKILVITGVSKNVIGTSGGTIGLYPVGTSMPQAAMRVLDPGTGIAPFIFTSSDFASGSKAAFPLYISGTTTRTPWTGSGKYDVYMIISAKFYKAPSVSFTSGTTTVPFSKFKQVYQ
jgi:hypothetical protein